MKKAFYILIMAFLWASYSLRAQPGIKAGINYSFVEDLDAGNKNSGNSWTVQNDIQYQPLLRPLFGFVINKESKYIGFRPEFILWWQGASVLADVISQGDVSISTETHHQIEGKLNAMLFEIPLNLVLSLPINKDKIQLFGGPFLASGNGSFKYTETYQEVSTYGPTKGTVISSGEKSGTNDYYSGFNIGFNMGISYNWDMKYLISCQYQFSSWEHSFRAVEVETVKLKGINLSFVYLLRGDKSDEDKLD